MSDWNAQTAEWYAKNYGDYPTNHLGLDALDLLDNSTIVDIGCGTGSALRHAASKIHGGTFIGVDPVPRMLEIAQELTDAHQARNRIEFRLGSAENLPVDDQSADYVLAFDSIDHWSDVEKGLIDVKRILAPNGIFALVKDKSVPSANQAIDRLITKLDTIEGRLVKRKEINQQGVSFILLVVTINE